LLSQWEHAHLVEQIAAGVPDIALAIETARLFRRPGMIAALHERLDRPVPPRIARKLSAFDMAMLTYMTGGDGIADLNRAMRAWGLEPVTSRGPALQLEGLTASAPQKSEGPLISVIVAAHNAEDTIDTALKSLIAQSWQSLEIIVVDDASTDQTAARAGAVLGRSNRRHLIVSQKRNQGAYAARNRGLSLASGEKVACFDADDWVHPQWLETVMAQMAAHPDCKAVSVRGIRIDDQSGVPFTKRVYPFARFMPISLLFDRASAAQSVGYWLEDRFGADSEFVDRFEAVFGNRSHIRMKVPFLFMRHHTGSATNQAGSGTDAQGRSLRRLQFQEHWRAWHETENAFSPALPLPAGRHLADIWSAPT